MAGADDQLIGIVNVLHKLELVCLPSDQDQSGSVAVYRVSERRQGSLGNDFRKVFSSGRPQPGRF